MDKSLISVNESTVEGIGRLAKYFGFAEIIGRLYGTLLMSPDPLSLDDLVNQLEISKGSVSMNMRSLERWGMAKEIWVRGERKKYYAAEHDLWQVIRNVLSSRELREVQIAIKVLGDSVEKLKNAEGDLSQEDKELATFYLERIGDLQALFTVAQLALETVLGGSNTLDFDAVTQLTLE